MTSILKLRSKDGKIIKVDSNVIQQMVAIQTMLECPGVEENNDDDDEPIPIFAVNGEVLDKLVGWTKHNLENSDKSEYKVWCDQFFMDNLGDILELEESAKYLDLRRYLETNDLFMDENFQVLSKNKNGDLWSQARIEI